MRQQTPDTHVPCCILSSHSNTVMPRQTSTKKRNRRNVMYEDDADAQDDIGYQESEVINRAGATKKVRIAVSLEDPPAPPVMQPPPNTSAGQHEAPAEFLTGLEDDFIAASEPPRATKVKKCHSAEIICMLNGRRDNIIICCNG